MSAVGVAEPMRRRTLVETGRRGGGVHQAAHQRGGEEATSGARGQDRRIRWCTVVYGAQFLQRFSPERRYATLVAFLLETCANLTDEAIELHDRLIGQYHTQTRQAHAAPSR